MDIQLGIVTTTAAAVLAAALATGLRMAPALPLLQDAPKSDVAEPAKLNYSMARKLAHSQGLFGALAVKDLDAASQEAQKLGRLGLDEGWNVVQSPEYSDRTDDFRRTIAALDRAARE
ncbi:MAG: hypothetical protein EXS13_05605 [Planctomycetes bacterium]|nr:hypothetical protein [Planctomycetota bacterium]